MHQHRALVPIAIEAGLNVLSIRSRAQPLRLATDDRPLAAVVKNLTIRRHRPLHD